MVVAGLLRSRGVEVGHHCTFYGVPRVHRARGTRIVLGDGVSIRSGGVCNPLSQGLPCVLRTVLPGAALKIGDRTGISSAVISCWGSIELREDILVGAGVVITDSDAHVLCADCRSEGVASQILSLPILVGSGTFVGARAAILKGAMVGPGSVIGFGSVVIQGEYPGRSLLAGVPAEVKRSVKCEIHA